MGTMQSMFQRVNHSDGMSLYSGAGERAHPEMRSVLRNLPLEYDRVLRARWSCLDPSNMGTILEIPQGNNLYGNGFRIGSQTEAHIPAGTGTQEDGYFHLSTVGGANDINNLIGPQIFAAEADTVIRFHAKVKVTDISAMSWIVGLVKDETLVDDGVVGDLIDDTDGVPGDSADMDEGIVFHHLAAAGGASIFLSVYDDGDETASQEIIALPETLTDDAWIELGLIIDGVSTIRSVIKVGDSVVANRFTCGAGGDFPHWTAATQDRLGLASSLHHVEAETNSVIFNGMGAIQTFA